MPMPIRFVSTPNGTIAVVEVQSAQLEDELAARRLRLRIGAALGGMPTLLRCRAGNTVSFSGEHALARYASDPVVDAHPVVDVAIRREAA